MSRITLSIVTVAVLVASTGSAFAQRHEANERHNEEQVQNNRGQNQRAQVQNRNDQRNQPVQQARSDRARVGQQMNRQNVVVVNDWNRRGLQRPGANEAYVMSGDDLLLVAATSLIVKALMN